MSEQVCKRDPGPAGLADWKRGHQGLDCDTVVYHPTRREIAVRLLEAMVRRDGASIAVDHEKALAATAVMLTDALLANLEPEAGA